ncbi:hypothetical protein KK137_09115 [Croceibacterium sp. LX-88]|uniref:Uncharacterized protein n=1 Tax=Croceibacterium selenioxidans TaxID=2838833 RepID=A0ABS5W4S1_9SPHN|nr:hypothetical protein [Croceibacterium selenioxidans]MBT2134491.1 hypothetical protein [Croceibacterium selenioxidans]
MNCYELHDFYQRRADSIFVRYKTAITILLGFFFGGWTLAQLIGPPANQTLDAATFVLAIMILFGVHERLRVDKMLRLNAKDYARDHQALFPDRPRIPFLGVDAGSFVDVTPEVVPETPTPQGFAAREDPGFTAFWICIGYVIGMWFLMAMPAWGLLSVWKSIAVESQGVVSLSPIGHAALLAIGLATFFFSLGIGGFARAFIRPEMVGPWWLLGVGCILFLGLPFLFDSIRNIATTLGAWDQGDNATIVAFLTFWILMIGYAAKVLWDELRDRVAAKFPGFGTSSTPAFDGALERPRE